MASLSNLCLILIETTLVNMYAACGDIRSARTIFESMGEKNQVAWTTMISGYAKNHYPREALLLYNEMEKEEVDPDEVTMACLISACTELRDLECGKKLHAHIHESGMRICIVLGTALVDMYAKCGKLESARQLFDNLPEKNVVAWSAMIFGYTQNNQSEEALTLFKEMVGKSNQKPNEITILAALSACAHLVI
jgi:pentatricopeptide repeat protein